jgi:hypothetical protein
MDFNIDKFLREFEFNSRYIVINSKYRISSDLFRKELNKMPAKTEGKRRAKPGTTGEGEYFRIELRSKGDFTTFRYHDVGDKGHLQRLAGKRPSGSWDTQTWLVSKDDAHIEGDTLVPDTEDAKQLIESLGSQPKHIKGDVFEAKDKPTKPKGKKPAEA